MTPIMDLRCNHQLKAAEVPMKQLSEWLGNIRNTKFKLLNYPPNIPLQLPLSSFLLKILFTDLLGTCWIQRSLCPQDRWLLEIVLFLSAVISDELAIYWCELLEWDICQGTNMYKVRTDF